MQPKLRLKTHAFDLDSEWGIRVYNINYFIMLYGVFISYLYSVH